MSIVRGGVAITNASGGGEVSGENPTIGGVITNASGGGEESGDTGMVGGSAAAQGPATRYLALLRADFQSREAYLRKLLSDAVSEEHHRSQQADLSIQAAISQAEASGARALRAEIDLQRERQARTAAERDAEAARKETKEARADATSARQREEATFARAEDMRFRLTQVYSHTIEVMDRIFSDGQAAASRHIVDYASGSGGRERAMSSTTISLIAATVSTASLVAVVLMKYNTRN